METESLNRAVPLPGFVLQVDDPALASWEFGRRWTESRDSDEALYTLWLPDAATGRAWLVDGTPDLRAERLALPTLSKAKVLPWQSRVPEELTVTLEVREPATVVVSQWDDPHWHATWTFGTTRAEGAAIVPAFVHPGGGGWQAIATPSHPGRWTLTLRYDGMTARASLLVSEVAWFGWFLAYCWFRTDRSELRRQRDDSSLLPLGEGGR
jgi:hypothetical protein